MQICIFVSSFICLLILHIVPCEGSKPPKDPPEDLISKFTLDGSIPLERYYVDDTIDGTETHFVIPAALILKYIDGARKQFKKMANKIGSEDGGNAAPIVHPREWVHYAMYKHREMISAPGAVHCVFGSADPWLETALLALNATAVKTIEYNNLTYEHEAIETFSKYDFGTIYSCESGSSSMREACDVAWSLSSFDHDGLGRYGDPLNPNGDLVAMQQAKKLLRPGGHMFLTVPIGPDIIVFNLHRRYGPIRLPLLLAGWEIEQRLFWDERRLEAPADFRKSYEPILVLRKPFTDSEATDECTAAVADEL